MPGPMVGRARQLAELVRVWSVVANSDNPASRAAVITGEAGVGKSLLVAVALEEFSPRPASVLFGTARVHSPAPYDWLAAVLGGRDLNDLPGPPDALAWLAQRPDAPQERYAPTAMLRLAVRVVRALVGDGPAVLVVEDLHALDPASLNLIGELARTPDLPVLLIVTSQPPGSAVAPQLAARTLARVSGTPGAVRQHLTPLGRADVAEMLRHAYAGCGEVSAKVVRAVWERTGGNPYLVNELLATARHRRPEALLLEPLPDHLRPATCSSAPVAVDLTDREIEVLRCLAAGMSNKQVARSLGISIRTVAVHVSNLLRKTRSASRTEAALWAIRHDLVRDVGTPVA